MKFKLSYTFLSFMLFCFSSVYAGFNQRPGNLGLVLIPAENYDSLRVGSKGDTFADSTTFAGFIGSGYMQGSDAQVYNPNTTAEPDAPKLSYEINFKKTGAHYIWVRKYFIDGSNDSFYYGLGDSIHAQEDMVPHGAYGVWEWVQGPNPLDIPTTGMHELSIYLRERGAAIDHIILTSSATFNPNTDLNISFIYDGSLTDDATGESPDQPTMDLLSSEGYNVSPLSSSDLSSEPQATIDALNNAGLVIAGRTIYSGQVQGANKAIWNGIEAPLMVTSVYDVRSSRLGWFNSTSLAKDENTGDTLKAKVMLPEDDVFADVTLTDSVMSWAVSPYETINVTSAGNGEAVVKSEDGSIMLMARFDPWTEFYDGAGAWAAGYRTYMGNGYDGGGAAPWNYLSSYTKEAQSVFLNEVARMVALEKVEKPVGFGKTIAFVVLPEKLDRDQPFIDDLLAQEYTVNTLYSSSLSTASQGLLDTLNNADLVIIGRSGSSSDFGGSNKEAWNNISAPVMDIHPWTARSQGSTRLNWLNTTSVTSYDNVGDTIVAKIELPDDPVFTGATIAEDSTMDWVVSPYDYIVATSGGNGTVVARSASDGNVFFVRWDPWVEFYKGAGDWPAGYRTLIGNGNDHAHDGGDGSIPVNYYNYTDQAKQVYLNEVARMTELPVPPEKPVGLGKEIVFVGLPGKDNPDTPEAGDADKPFVDDLLALDYKVTMVYSASLSTASQGLVDTLNNADLVIIGRSGSSGDFGDNNAADRAAWNAITSPMLNLHLYTARTSRMNWLNTNSAAHNDAVGDTIIAKIEVPDDSVFIGATISDSSTMEWVITPSDYIVATDGGNGTVLARAVSDSNVLYVRWDPWVEFYDGSGDMPAGYRTLIGNGNDHTTPFNYYNFTDEAKQVYLNEVARMAKLGKVENPNAISDDNNNVPVVYALGQNYPNPFNPETSIKFSLQKAGRTTLKIYNTLGQLVATLVDKNMNAGVHTITFNAVTFSSGVYFYRIESGDFVKVKKMALIK